MIFFSKKTDYFQLHIKLKNVAQQVSATVSTVLSRFDLATTHKLMICNLVVPLPLNITRSVLVTNM